MLGKKKCKILKEIRQRIADENEIPYVTRECTHKGNCSGTCPYCESELRYLEDQLKQRASLGKRVTVAALCAGMSLAVTGCDVLTNVSGMLVRETPTPEVYILDGEVPMPTEDPAIEPDEQEDTATEEYELAGAPVIEPEDEMELVGTPTLEPKSGNPGEIIEVVDDLSGYVS